MVATAQLLPAGGGASYVFLGWGEQTLFLVWEARL